MEIMHEQSEEKVKIPLPKPKMENARNLIGFWLLGLCNNYAYVIMLSAAFDLLGDGKTCKDPLPSNCTGKFSNETECNNTGNGKLCNPVSTGAILLADILPALFVKLIAPFLVINTHFKVFIVVALSAGSFIITSLSKYHWMTYLGVVCASVSSGLGEVTLLAFSSYFGKNVISTWSSGTGAAGVLGALSYAVLAKVLTVNSALQVMLVIPVLMVISFWIILVHPPGTGLKYSFCSCDSELLKPILEDNRYQMKEAKVKKRSYTLQEKIRLVKPLLRFMIPLSLVYFAEYFINQGLMEIIYFPKIFNWLSHCEQYRWYQVDYQVGVLISRSSVNFFQVKKLWILPVLQFINLTFLLFESYYSFLPWIWIVLAIIFYEGLLGGCAYVNTFYRMSQEVDPEHKEFSLGVASLGDSFGIAIAGAVSIPVHNALCNALSS